MTTMDEREIPIAPHQHLWALDGHRVWEITAWRVARPSSVIAVVPGSPDYQTLTLGTDVFASEHEAYRENMIQIDVRRRLLDDLAELNIRHLTRLAERGAQKSEILMGKEA